MSCHAALGVVRSGVAVLKGTVSLPLSRPYLETSINPPSGSGVRINCVSSGQIDIGVDLKSFDMRGMTAQLPPAALQSAEVRL